MKAPFSDILVVLLLLLPPRPPPVAAAGVVPAAVGGARAGQRAGADAADGVAGVGALQVQHGLRQRPPQLHQVRKLVPDRRARADGKYTSISPQAETIRIYFT